MKTDINNPEFVKWVLVQFLFNRSSLRLVLGVEEYIYKPLLKVRTNESSES